MAAMRTKNRRTMTMCLAPIKLALYTAERERYRRFAEAKRRIPMNLPPREYAAEVNRLAKKYKI